MTIPPYQARGLAKSMTILFLN